MNIRIRLLCAAIYMAVSLAPAAHAKTFVVPHVLETTGSIASYTVSGNQYILRESPTRQSTGRVTLTDNDVAGGIWRVSSFFDIFTELSSDGGQTWTPDTMTFSSEYTLPPIAIDEPGVQVYDTEMLSMSLRGINSPNLLLRESPTLQSRGHVTVLKSSTCADGSCSDPQIDSFFDIFTEISLDGGQNWTPSNSPQLHMTMSSVPLPAGIWLFASGLIGLAGVARKRKAA